jgi:hypothetical protein
VHVQSNAGAARLSRRKPFEQAGQVERWRDRLTARSGNSFMETVWTGVPAPISITCREESWAVKASFSPEGDQLTPWTQPLAESICISTWEVQTGKQSGSVKRVGCTEEKPEAGSSGVVEA